MNTVNEAISQIKRTENETKGKDGFAIIVLDLEAQSNSLKETALTVRKEIKMLGGLEQPKLVNFSYEYQYVDN